MDESPVVHEQRVRAEFPSCIIFLSLFNIGGGMEGEDRIENKEKKTKGH